MQRNLGGTNTEIGRIHSPEWFLYLLDKEVKRARRHRDSFCILKLTVSQLTNKEDDKGLQTCFERLIQFIGEELRESDILGFLGEHQLAVIFPYADPNAASYVQSRLERSLEYFNSKKESCEVKILRTYFPADASNTAALIGKIMEKEEAPGNS
jgi:PleD family two-component response regulator